MLFFMPVPLSLSLSPSNNLRIHLHVRILRAHTQLQMLYASLYIPGMSLGIHKGCNMYHGNQRTSILGETKDLSTQVSCL